MDDKFLRCVLRVEEFIKQKNIQYNKDKRELSVIQMKDIGRKGTLRFIREAWTFLPQHNLNKKVFVFERLRKVKHQGALAFKSSWQEGDREYRIGYFIVGKIGKAKGRWWWGQSCPLIPVGDFEKLITQAKREKVFV